MIRFLISLLVIACASEPPRDSVATTSMAMQRVQLASPCGPTQGTVLRTVYVADTTQLKAALAGALPGDSIVLATGTYKGFRTITLSGTAANPIYLTGPKTANVGGTGTAPTGMNLKLQANYWVFSGFSMTSTFQPIFLIGASHNVISNLEISSTGNSGIRLKNQSSHNVLDSNYIHDTGKNPGSETFGEAIYIGTANSKWCAENGCNPDKSDSNAVSRNTVGPNISAEMINVKDGVTGTRKWGNHYNGTGRGSTSQVAFVHDFGSSGLDSANTYTNPASNPFPNGYYVEQVGLAAGASTVGYPWGQNNVFMSDTLSGGPVAGYGFKIGNGSKVTTTIWCTNVVSGFTLGTSNKVPVCAP